MVMVTRKTNILNACKNSKIRLLGRLAQGLGNFLLVHYLHSSIKHVRWQTSWKPLRTQLLIVVIYTITSFIEELIATVG